jgi:hypothetical protein
LNFVKIGYQNENECVITRFATPENLATGILTLKFIKLLDNSVFETIELNVRVVNPNVIMTMDTNPEVLKVLYKYCSHRMSSPNYLLKTEAEAFENSDFYVSDTVGIFFNSNIIHFEEFEYFTKITTIPAYCFAGCINLVEILLPESIETINARAFQNTKLDSIFLPKRVKTLDKTAFLSSTELTSISVDFENVNYYSTGGNVYTGARAYTLYVLAPGITEYVMPNETIAVADSPQDV